MMRYICQNCGTYQKTIYVRAMLKAGFGLNHVPCRECGRAAIKITEPDKEWGN
jgi:RNase P subunit RPR2